MKSSDHLHFIGIGGIGMSGVAQFCRSLGCRVTGSDRDADKPENRHIFAALRHQGIRIYPQDGSFRRDGKPDWLIYSTAVEEGNPDFKADPTIPRLHRAAALAAALELNGDVCQIAVSGSCGKTTVTAYLAEALRLLGLDAGCLDGGLVKAFRNDTYCGNFHPGKTFFVYEADESDKSLVAFSPDFALVLNIGTDHYDREELIRVFGEFLKKVGTGVVLSREVYQALAPVLPPALTVSVFDTAILNEPRENVPHFISNYQAGDGGAEAEYDGAFTVQLPQPGFHTALNLLAAGLLLELLNIPFRDAVKTLAQVHGVARRFDCRGRTATGAFVYDDYAHTPDALGKAIASLRDLYSGRRITVLFGCGGERDREKRSMMGAAAEQGADSVIITSDNCRSEEPMLIISEILSGVLHPEKMTVISDRREAIIAALDRLEPDGVLLLAGKGHEEYIIDRDGRHRFSEREIVSDYAKGR